MGSKEASGFSRGNMKNSIKKMFTIVATVLIVLIIVSCQRETIPSEALSSGAEQGISVPVATPQQVIDITATSEQFQQESPTLTDKATEPVVEMPDNSSYQPTVNVYSSAVYYNLPQTTMTEATGLFASPNRGDLITPLQIAPGQIVYIMGRNGTRSHLRVVWNTGVGWIPASFTDYNNQKEKMDALPVFQREPPACAVPIITQFNLDSKYTVSDKKQRVAVVIDIFRSQYGEFPASHLALTVNGKTVDSSKRKIIEKGQFSLKDVVFTLPDYLQQGDVLGYQLETTSNEPLVFLATIFSVPENCAWDID